MEVQQLLNILHGLDTSTVCFSLLLVPILMLLTLGFNKIRYGGKNLPPGTMGWPVFGETVELLTNVDAFVHRRRSRYGDVFKTHIFGCPTIICMDAELNRFLLLNEARGFPPGYPQSTVDLMGKSNVMAVQNDLHRRMRGTLLSLINTNVIRDIFLAQIDDYMRFHLSDLGGQVVDMQEKSKEIAFYFLVEKIIGLGPGPEVKNFKREYYKLGEGLFCIPLDIPGSAYRRGLQARKKILAELAKLLHKRRHLDRDSHHDLLANLIHAEIDVTVKTQLTDEQILDFLVGIILAGHETTAGTILMTLKFLHGCPRALQELRSEHQIIRRRKRAEEKLSLEDYRSMAFTRRVINETMRLGSTVSGVLRKTTGDTEIYGYMVPKNWKILVYMRDANRSSKLYQDPFQFNPWRLQNGESFETPDFMPFGAGTRMCPGKDLAMLEMCIFLHHFVTLYEWEEIGSDEKINDFPRIYAPKGLTIRLSNVMYVENDEIME